MSAITNSKYTGMRAGSSLLRGWQIARRRATHRFQVPFQLFTHTAKLLHFFTVDVGEVAVLLTFSCTTLPGRQDFQTVLVGKSSVPHNIGGIAVIAGGIEFRILNKFGLFHI